MPLHPSWPDIALRLALTVLAGAMIGFNRGERGRAAGLRTTILVALAAAIAMIQANLLLPVSGKTADSFGVMDLMRMPLGILTGVGFIGGGAILRRGDLVTGVTTAATLWVVTTIGLCFGGDQLALGVVGTALAVVTLTTLRWVDLRLPREHRASLTIEGSDAVAIVPALARLVAPFGYSARFASQGGDCGRAILTFEVVWTRAEIAGPALDLLQLVAAHYRIVAFHAGAAP